MKANFSLILVLTVILQSCWSSFERVNREECIPSFESNFGFTPPPSVTEIKVKNYGFRDGTAQWMRFTYDSDVFNQIIEHDSPLEKAIVSTSAHAQIIREFAKANPNIPAWFIAPNDSTPKIYFKKMYLDHTFSEYYVWVDSKEALVYLYVHYFD